MKNLDKYKELLEALQTCNAAVSSAQKFHPTNSEHFTLKWLDEALNEVMWDLETFIEENEKEKQ